MALTGNVPTKKALWPCGASGPVISRHEPDVLGPNVPNNNPQYGVANCDAENGERAENGDSHRFNSSKSDN
jgi:hypothetical protein